MVIDRNSIIESAFVFTQESPQNYVSADTALSPECIGLKIFEAPLIAFGAADDMIFSKYKSADIIGDHFMAPVEWLPNAKTVISFFLPYTDRIKYTNSVSIDWPADEWLHGRYEGQKFINALSERLKESIQRAGCESIVPLLDKRFKAGNGITKFTSNWSERHIGFACGLGTFGLSRGLITEKGMCGRFGSVITELELSADIRPYSDVYEYCTMCGACVPQCPVHDITLEDGKKYTQCSDFLDRTLREYKPRYGCGKCQIGVPCESGIP